MLRSRRIFLGATFLHVFFHRNLAHTDCAHEVRSQAQFLVTDPLFPDFLRDATCPWRI